jgi:hypothetical protein
MKSLLLAPVSGLIPIRVVYGINVLGSDVGE